MRKCQVNEAEEAKVWLFVWLASSAGRGFYQHPNSGEQLGGSLQLVNGGQSNYRLQITEDEHHYAGVHKRAAPASS